MIEPSALRWLLLLTVVMLWGSSFALLKLAVATIPPVWVMALRLSIGGCALLALLFATGGRLAADVRSWISFLVIALVGNVVPFLLIAWGIRYIPSGLSGILMAVMPLGVALLSHFFLPDEPLTWRRSAGFLLGFLGVAVLLGPRRLISLGSEGLAIWGQLAMILAALCYSVQSIITRRIRSKGTLETAAAALSIAGAVGLALAVFSDPTGVAAANASSMFAVLLLALFNTALATVAFFHLIGLAGAGFASMINYLIPAFAVLVGWIFLDERLAYAAFAGLALILAGIAVVQSRAG